MTGRLTSVRVRRWCLRDNEPHDFHARYVLTDRGGYNLDKGPRLRARRGTTGHASRPPGMAATLQGYGDANPFFEKVDTFTLDKSGALRLEPPLDESTKHAQ